MDANEVSLVSIRDLGDGRRLAKLTGGVEAGTTMRQRTGEEKVHAPLSLHGGDGRGVSETRAREDGAMVRGVPNLVPRQPSAPVTPRRLTRADASVG